MDEFEKVEKLRQRAEVSYAEAKEALETCRWGRLVLDERRHLVTYADEEITLTNREFVMLKLLLDNQDIVLSREVLLDKVCGYDYLGETNLVDVYIR